MTKRQRLDRDCLKLCGDIVLLRSDFRCQCGCGRPAKDPSHVFDRDCQNTRYDLDNLVALARHCHDHDKPRELKAIHRKILGEKYEEVEARSKVLRAPWRVWELELLKEHLKATKTDGIKPKSK
jgi:hypothetical protein